MHFRENQSLGSRKLGADCPGNIIPMFAELFLSIHSTVMWLNFEKQNVVCKWVWSSGSQKMIWMILHREMNPKNLQWHGNIPIFTTRKNLGFHPHCWFLGHCVWGGLNTWFEWLMSEMNVSLNRVAKNKPHGKGPIEGLKAKMGWISWSAVRLISFSWREHFDQRKASNATHLWMLNWLLALKHA